MKHYIAILLIALTVSSCQKRYPVMQRLTCPPYDPTFLHSWFPYEEGQTYYYKSSTGDTHWLELDNIRYYDGDEALGCTPPEECIPSGNIFAHRDVNQYDKIWLNVHHYISNGESKLELMWNSIHAYILVNDDGTFGLNPVYYDRPEDYYKETKPDLTHHDNISLGGKNYTDVYEITFHKNDMGNARTIYLAKGRGIVAYQTQDGTDYLME